MHCPMCIHYEKYVNRERVMMNLEIWQNLKKSFEQVLIVGKPDNFEFAKIEKMANDAGYDVAVSSEKSQKLMDYLNIRYIIYPGTEGFFDVKENHYVDKLPVNYLHKSMLNGEILIGLN